MSKSLYFQNFAHAPRDKGFFLTFEGIEGSGKSTQIKIFRDYLESEGYEVHFFREPGGTELGEQLRNVMLHSKTDVDPMAQALIFCAARAQQIQQNILPALKNEKSVVILDRYFDSTFAYQGEAGGLGLVEMIKLHAFPPLNLLPNLTFYLKIDLETSIERQRQRGQEKDYFESKNQEFYLKLIEGYDKLAKVNSERIKTINAQAGQSQVTQEIQDVWREFRG